LNTNNLLHTTAAKIHWGRWLDKLYFSILHLFYRGTTMLLRTPRRFLAAGVVQHFTNDDLPLNFGTNGKNESELNKKTKLHILSTLLYTFNTKR